jgi:hypothetical protein
MCIPDYSYQKRRPDALRETIEVLSKDDPADSEDGSDESLSGGVTIYL